MPNRELALIVAMDPDRTIGRDGDLPWRYPEDLRWFKQMTLGHALVMGRRCHASIGKPLPGRRNLVLTRNRDYEAPGCELFHDYDAAIASAYETDPRPFVIGGADIYARALPTASHLYITDVLKDYPGDVRFPSFDEHRYVEIWRRAGASPDLLFRVLRRTV